MKLQRVRLTSWGLKTSAFYASPEYTVSCTVCFCRALFRIRSSIVFFVINLRQLETKGLPIDVDVFGLANSVRSICRLGVHCRIPIVVKKDNCIRCGQGHAQPSGARAQYEREN